MTRKLLLFLASTMIAFQAMAVEPMSNDATPNAAALSLPLAADAAEEDDTWSFWWEAGANIASNYLWRGYDQPYTGNMFDPAIQPSVTLGYGNFYVDLWYNFSTISKYQEFDMTLGFDYENLSITRLRLHWGTTFLHSSDWLYNEDGTRKRRAFSSYFEVAYIQPVKDLFDIEVVAGASPWTGPFWTAGKQIVEDGERWLDYDPVNPPVKGFNVTNLSLTLSREFEVGRVTFPVSAGYTCNPVTNRHYALIKTGFSF